MKLITILKQAIYLFFLLPLIMSGCSGSSTPVYVLEVTPTPSEGGSVTPASGEFEEGEVVDVMAQPNENYIFDSWQGDISGTDNPVEVVMENDMIFTALFEKLEFPLELNIEGGGSVEQNVVEAKTTDYEHGTVVELTAIADDGWRFLEWQGDLSGSENPETITIDEEKSVTAVFELDDFSLEVDIVGEGNVHQEIVETAEKTDYESGTTVELTAEPDFGWTFVEWQGDLQGDENPQTILMDEDKSVTAVFERDEFELNIEVEGNGSVSDEVIDDPGKSFTYETVVELTAEADEGWQFARWEGDLSGSNNPEQITIDDNKNVVAVFEREGFELTINTDGDGDVQTEVIDDPSKTSTYPFETVLELTAESSAGWEFSHWEGDLSGSGNPQQITMDQDKEVTAVFEMEEYSLSTNTDGSGSIDVDPDQSSYHYGDEVTLTAQPADGWNFVEWQGDLSGSSNPETITMDGDKSITAVFETQQFSINTSTDGNGSVSLDPDKSSYSYNEEVTITANPSSDWEFDGWQGDLSGSNNPETFTVTSNMSITAVFTEVPISERACYVYSESEISSARDQLQAIYNSSRIKTDYHNLANNTADFYDDILDELENVLVGEHDESLFQQISTVQNAIQDDLLTSDDRTAEEQTIGMFIYYELSYLYFYIHSCRNTTITELPQHDRIPNWAEVTTDFQNNLTSIFSDFLKETDTVDKIENVDNRFSDRYDNDLGNIMNHILAVFSKYGS